MTGALERQLQDVLHEPEAPAAPGPAAQPSSDAIQPGQPAATRTAALAHAAAALEQANAALAAGAAAAQQPPASSADAAYRYSSRLNHYAVHCLLSVPAINLYWHPLSHDGQRGEGVDHNSRQNMSSWLS